MTCELVQELPRAMAPKCLGLFAELECDDATVLNIFRWYGESGNESLVLCAACEADARTVRDARGRAPNLDIYLPILLATVGDELWISLECWTRQLGEQVRIMAEVVQP